MANTLFGIRREDKNIWERRTPLTPDHAGELMRKHPVDFRVQPSAIRIFQADDYRQEGCIISEDLSPCSIILAVKEIPVEFFREGRVYVFFSHTIKGQPGNMPMLKRMMDLRCTLIDYERVVDEQGRRLVFFGQQAGQAGMIDTLWALGRRLEAEKIDSPFAAVRKTIDYPGLAEAKEAIQKVGWEIKNNGLHAALVPLVFGFTGYGHVSRGAQEIFEILPFEEVAPAQLKEIFSRKSFGGDRVYKTVFREEDMVEPKKSGQQFNLQEYYDYPERYNPVLDQYIPYLTVLINAIYWSPKYPRFISKEFLKDHYSGARSPRLRVIGDISCDIDGGVECTVKCTTPAEPVFTYDPEKDEAVEGVKGRGPVIMAVDNLPAEIALESSVFFSQTLKPFIPALAAADYTKTFEQCSLPPEIKKAVILFRGELTADYKYMSQFISD